jgi:hypothetical protein
MRHRLVAVALAAFAGAVALAQGLNRDDAHCTTANGLVVVACWNETAGQGIPENTANHPQVPPEPAGMGFSDQFAARPLPIARRWARSAIAMAGVIEDAGPLYQPQPGRVSGA